MRSMGVLLAVLLLAGCSGQAVDTDEIETTIAKQMREQIDEKPDVACPDGLEWQAGGEFHCIAKVDGYSARVTVTMENEDDWTWKID